MSNEIMVSISCITFNHVDYIKDALNGFLMQETNFKYEVLIHDDASTDGTEEIIREYEAKHPDIIKPLYEKENQWVKGRQGSATFNFPRAKGKYIALCEGDDYWIDPLKLKKQVDFLESNCNYSLICGGYYINDIKNGNKVIKQGKGESTHKNLNGFSFDINQFDQWKTKTLTVMFRNITSLSDQVLSYKYTRDVVLFYHILKKGKGFYMQETLGVYNVHDGGVHSGTKKIKRLNFSVNCYRELYQKNGDNILRKILLRQTLALLNHKLYKVKGKTTGKLKLFKESLRLVRRFPDVKYFGFLLPIS